MEKIGKLRHELRTENMISSESSTYQIIEVVNALVDAHNELLETHTVKEPEEIKVKKIELKAISEFGPLDIHVKNPSTMKNTCCGTQNGESWGHSGPCWNPEVTPPSNSEKEECCEMLKNGQGFHNLSCHKEEVREDDRFEKNGLARNPNPEGIYSPPKAPEKCYCGNSVEDHEAYLSTSSCHVKPTPEKKIHCFDCGAQTMKDCVHHKETDAPEKKPSERIKELEKRLKKDQPNPMDDLVKYSIYCANMKVRAVINYLDELHSKGKL